MLRLCSNLRVLPLVPQGPHNCESVRWIRKPRKPLWMPPAKSKLFKVPPRPKIPEEEEKELQRLHNNYRTSMKSIRRFLTYRYSVSLQAKADTEALNKAVEEDFARCLSINDKWNEEIRKEREQRVAKELEEEIEFAKKRKEEVLLKREQNLEAADEIVRREKEAVVKFIKREDLDEVIEKAISNPVDYNFAIDLQGNRIYGRETKPNEVKVKQ